MTVLQDMIIEHLETSHRSILVPYEALRRKTMEIKILFFFVSFLYFFLFISNKASLKFHTGITVSSLMLLP